MTEPAPDTNAGRVGRTARVLGFAGLLPAVATTLAMVAARRSGTADLQGVLGIALIYPLLILSFLGGAWWGLAMRIDARQPMMAVTAVVPSLIALGLLGMLGWSGRFGTTLVALGSVLALTLLVDRRLVELGAAPAGWLALRVPLSLGLGGLTILAGVLVGDPVTVF